MSSMANIIIITINSQKIIIKIIYSAPNINKEIARCEKNKLKQSIDEQPSCINPTTSNTPILWDKQNKL